MTAMEEQETTVSACRSDDTVLIYTTNTVHLKKLRSNIHAVETSGGEDWGCFSVPTSLYDPLTGFHRTPRVLSEEQRAAQRERMAKARAAKAGLQ